MAQVSYSKIADRDLRKIIDYTRKHWGQAQAEQYFDSFVKIFDLLAQQVSMGRPFSSKRPTWLRFEHESHVIVYEPSVSGIRIQRIVHERQLIEKIVR